jgi:hypothetical protein
MNADKQVIEALVSLNNRMKELEETNANMVIIVHGFCDRLETLKEKVEGLTKPVVVDKDGEVIEVTDALVAMFDGFQASVKAEVAEVKAWFQQHIDDHAKNGGRPAQATLKQLSEFVDKNI